jgi:hypothetical protein
MKVGALISTWFSRSPSGKSRILEILPYTGRYPQYFDCVLKVTAPATKQGYMEIAYNSNNFQYEE